MIQEFKDFIMKGNVLDLAIAVIIAGAFGTVITTFTNEVLMPPIGQALGGVDFSDLKYVLQAASGEGDTAISEVAIMWGKWLNTIINFLIIAFILFLIIRANNKVNPPAPAAPAAPAGPSDNDLLTEIRDALKK